MKKKILLKTLIPLASVGITLGTALPLVSCSCGDNDDSEAFIFTSLQQLNDFVTSESSKVFIDDADAHTDWSTRPADFQEMIDWFNDRFNAEMFALVAMVQNAWLLDFSKLVTFQYKQEVAIFSATILSSGWSIEWSASKSANVYYINTKIRDEEDNESGSLVKAGTNPETGLRTLTFVGSLISSGDILPEFWQYVQFPTADPTT